jgi:DNA-binding NtrC family response regulator
MTETRNRGPQWIVTGGLLKTPEGRALIIDVDPLVIGHDPAATLVVDDPDVSPFHCELRAAAEGILVRDLHSAGGTFLGTVRVLEALVTTPCELTVGRSRIVIEPQDRHKVEVGSSERFGPLVGNSARMRRIFGLLERVANLSSSLLVFGETGTGKELVAKAIHDASERKGSAFVVVDCGSIPPTLAESILFGHERGAFTGATERRKGALAEADGGTLFLDELGELPIDLQPGLLSALGEKRVKRVGGSAFDPIDVRVVAATRRDLGAEMNAGRFRSDLFSRIAEVRIELPPLRERLTDLPFLVDDVCQRVGKPQHVQVVLSWIEQRMRSHDWPGNVRELVNVASVAATLADEPGAIDDALTLARDDVADAPRAPGSGESGFSDAKRGAISAFEREYFTSLARRSRGNVSEMARQSGMERHHVRAYLRKYGIDKTGM